jgi:hypothetical protein
MIKQQINLIEAKALIRKKFKDGISGTSGMFINLGEYGVKLYDTQWTAMAAFERQRKAFANNIGPEPYYRIDIQIDNVKYYGYLTEVVEVLPPDTMARTELGSECWDDYRREYANDIRRVKYQLKKIGLYIIAYDMHPGNLGFKDGKVLCVDFS